MSSLSIEKTYQNTAVLSAADLDNIVDSIETFVNDRGIGSDNLNSGSITAVKLPAQELTGSKFSDASITKAKLVTYNEEESSAFAFPDPLSDLDVTITTTGGRVLLFFSRDTSLGSGIKTFSEAVIDPAASTIEMTISRSGTVVGGIKVVSPSAAALSGSNTVSAGLHQLQIVDAPPTGTHTYEVTIVGGGEFTDNIILRAVELI